MARWSRLDWLILVALASPASAYKAYVSNEKSNTVSVIDTDRLAVIKTIKVGQRPRGIELTNDDKYCLVAVGDDDTIQMIDTQKAKVTGTLPSGPDPELFALDRSGQYLYIANENDNMVSVVDMATRKRARRRAGRRRAGGHGDQPGRQDADQHVRNNQHGAFHRSRRRASSSASVLVDSRPRFAAFKHDNSELWVSSEVGGTVSIIDPVKHVVIGKSPIRRARPAQRGDPAGRHQYHQGRQDRLRRARAGQPRRRSRCQKPTKVKKYLLVGQRVWHMAFTPDQKYLLTTNGLTNDVSVIDVAALKVIKSIQVGQQPWGVTITRH